MLANPIRGSSYGTHIHQLRQEQPSPRYTHPQHPQPYMPASYSAVPYSQPQSHSYSYAYQTSSSAPQSPPSPPSEDTMKPSLPSIQSLLGISKQEQPPVTVSSQGPPFQPPHPSVEVHERSIGPPQGDYRSHPVPQHWSASKPNSSSVTLPPTPPLGPDPTDVQSSPSTLSTHSNIPPTPYYPPQNSVSIHGQHHRPTLPTDLVAKQPSILAHSPISPYTPTSYTASSYPPRSHVTTGTYSSPEAHSIPPPGMYAQRSLPSNFPPPVHAPLPNPQPAANPWQHHHYISANSQAAFPQTQDRYICPTCNKAFSRPSSLRIHSHSHTGEKPFKCSHAGCGKAFSVRSNMKRHERGCHAVASNAGPN